MRRSRTIAGIHRDFLTTPVGQLEEHVLEQRRHHRVKTPCTDVLHALVDLGGSARDLRDAIGLEHQACTFRFHERAVLLRERVLRLRHDAHEVGSVSGLSSTRIGNRPCNSGMRSLGFDTWNAPAAMNST